MSEVKRYTFDEICESQDFSHEEKFILASDYEHLKTKLELTNKELGLNIKSHLNDICTLEKLKAQLERAENTLKFYTEERSYKRSFDDYLGHVLLSEFLTQDWAPIVKDCGTMAREYFKEKESK